MSRSRILSWLFVSDLGMVQEWIGADFGMAAKSISPLNLLDLL